MLPKLSQSKNFLRDVNQWKSNIAQIDDKTYQKFVQAEFDKFILLAKEVDEAHDSRNNGNIKPYIIRDKLEELAKLRRKMPQYINDYFSSIRQQSS